MLLTYNFHALLLHCAITAQKLKVIAYTAILSYSALNNKVHGSLVLYLLNFLASVRVLFVVFSTMFSEFIQVMIYVLFMFLFIIALQHAHTIKIIGMLAARGR